MGSKYFFVLIISEYQALLERFATRYMRNKQMAYSVVKEVFEELYDQGLLVAGPELRSLLKVKTISTWQKIDASIARAEKALEHTFLSDDKPNDCSHD